MSIFLKHEYENEYYEILPRPYPRSYPLSFVGVDMSI